MNHTLKKPEEIKDDLSFYACLNCVASSSVEQIKAEYRELAKQFHPDKQEARKNTDGYDDKRITRINRAYKVLSNKDSREKYDAYLASELSISWEDFQNLGEHANEGMHWAAKARKPTLTDGQEKQAKQNSSTIDNLPIQTNQTNPIPISEPYVPNTILKQFRKGLI